MSAFLPDLWACLIERNRQAIICTPTMCNELGSGPAHQIIQLPNIPARHFLDGKRCTVVWQWVWLETGWSFKPACHILLSKFQMQCSRSTIVLVGGSVSSSQMTCTLAAWSDRPGHWARSRLDFQVLSDWNLLPVKKYRRFSKNQTRT